MFVSSVVFVFVSSVVFVFVFLPFVFSTLPDGAPPHHTDAPPASLASHTGWKSLERRGGSDNTKDNDEDGDEYDGEDNDDDFDDDGDGDDIDGEGG